MKMMAVVVWMLLIQMTGVYSENCSCRDFGICSSSTKDYHCANLCTSSRNNFGGGQGQNKDSNQCSIISTATPVCIHKDGYGISSSTQYCQSSVLQYECNEGCEDGMLCAQSSCTLEMGYFKCTGDDLAFIDIDLQTYKYDTMANKNSFSSVTPASFKFANVKNPKCEVQLSCEIMLSQNGEDMCLKEQYRYGNFFNVLPSSIAKVNDFQVSQDVAYVKVTSNNRQYENTDIQIVCTEKQSQQSGIRYRACSKIIKNFRVFCQDLMVMPGMKTPVPQQQYSQLVNPLHEDWRKIEILKDKSASFYLKWVDLQCSYTGSPTISCSFVTKNATTGLFEDFIAPNYLRCSCDAKYDQSFIPQDQKTSLEFNLGHPYQPTPPLYIKYTHSSQTSSILEPIVSQYAYSDTPFITWNKYDCLQKIKPKKVYSIYLKLDSDGRLRYTEFFDDLSGIEGCMPVTCTFEMQQESYNPLNYTQLTKDCSLEVIIPTDKKAVFMNSTMKITTYDGVSVTSNKITIVVSSEERMCGSGESNLTIGKESISIMATINKAGYFNTQMTMVSNSYCFDMLVMPINLNGPNGISTIQTDQGSFDNPPFDGQRRINFYTNKLLWTENFNYAYEVTLHSLSGNSFKYIQRLVQVCNHQLTFDPSLFNATASYSQNDPATYTVTGFIWNKTCNILGFQIEATTTQGDTLEFTQTITTPSKYCLSLAKDQPCVQFDINTSVVGSIHISIKPIVIEPNIELSPQIVTVRVLCPQNLTDQISYTKNAMQPLVQIDQYRSQDLPLTIRGFQSKMPSCVNITDFKILKNGKIYDSINGIRLSCSAQPCNQITIQKNLFQEIGRFTFQILAIDSSKNVTAVSNNITVEVMKLPNQFAPVMEALAPIVLKVSDPEKLVYLPTPTDDDRGDVPIFSEVEIALSAKAFTTFKKESNVLIINPNNNSEAIGKHVVTVTIDDQRGKLTEYQILVEVLAPEQVLTNETKTDPAVKNSTSKDNNTAATHSQNQTQVMQEKEKSANDKKQVAVAQTNANLNQITTQQKQSTNANRSTGMPNILVEWRIVSIGLTGIVNVEFTSFLDLNRLSKEKIGEQGLDFSVTENKDFRDISLENGNYQTRDLSIKSTELLDMGSNYLTFQLNFTNTTMISWAGRSYQDDLHVTVNDPSLFYFKSETIAVDSKSVSVEPKINQRFKGSSMSILPLVDMSLYRNQLIAGAGSSIKSSMNSFMLGSFTLNFVISFSMKKLLTAIRVLQMVAFMVFLRVGFSPISMLFIQQIYKFVTFKVIPEELMNSILLFFGLKKTNQSAASVAVAGARRMQEAQNDGEQEGNEDPVVQEESSFLGDLNMMLFGAVGFVIALLIGAIALSLLRNKRKLRLKLKKKMKIAFFNSIHQTVANASLPILYNSINQIIKSKALGKPVSSYLLPMLILIALCLYPFVMVKYLTRNEKRFYTNFEFYKSHISSLLGTDYNKVGFTCVINARRILYIGILVASHALPTGIQLILITLMSEAMMIMVLSIQPFLTLSQNRQEVANEVVMICFVYHMILFSDMVPDQPSDFKQAVGYSMVSFMMLTLFVFIGFIIQPVLMKIANRIWWYKKRRDFYVERKKRVQVAALTVMIQADYLRQLRDQKMQLVQSLKDQPPDIEDTLIASIKELNTQSNKVREAIQVNCEKIEELKTQKYCATDSDVIQFESTAASEKQLETSFNPLMLNSEQADLVQQLMKEKMQALNMQMILKDCELKEISDKLVREQPMFAYVFEVKRIITDPMTSESWVEPFDEEQTPQIPIYIRFSPLIKDQIHFCFLMAEFYFKKATHKVQKILNRRKQGKMQSQIVVTTFQIPLQQEDLAKKFSEVQNHPSFGQSSSSDTEQEEIEQNQQSFNIWKPDLPQLPEIMNVKNPITKIKEMAEDEKPNIVPLIIKSMVSGKSANQLAVEAVMNFRAKALKKKAEEQSQTDDLQKTRVQNNESQEEYDQIPESSYVKSACDKLNHIIQVDSDTESEGAYFGLANPSQTVDQLSLDLREVLQEQAPPNEFSFRKG